MSKVLNAGLIALAFSRVIEILFVPGASIQDKFHTIVGEATFGLSTGAFDTKAGLRMYTPVGGAAALGFVKSYLMKKFPVRR